MDAGTSTNVSLFISSISALTTIVLALLTAWYVQLTHALVEEARVAKYPNVYVDVEFDDIDVKFVVGNSGGSAAVDIQFDVKDSVPWRKIGGSQTGIKSISAVERGISYLAPGERLSFKPDMSSAIQSFSLRVARLILR